MNIRRKPKWIAGFFLGGTTLLIGGAAVAASLSPSSARMLHMSAAHQQLTSTMNASGGSAASSAPKAASSAKATAVTPTATSQSPKATQGRSTSMRAASAKAPITYTVRRGDTLSGIAAWFKLHGYGDLYAANAKVIGANPNKIQPGERITIGTHVMTVRGPA